MCGLTTCMHPLRMLRPLPTRKVKLLSIAIFLLLAGAVFGWGLHYKLSLYRTVEMRTAPAAKLLSEKERPAAAQAAAEIDGHAPEAMQSGAPRPLAMLSAVLLLLAMPSHLLQSGTFAAQKRPLRRTRAWLLVRSLRPPPSFQLL